MAEGAKPSHGLPPELDSRTIHRSGRLGRDGWEGAKPGQQGETYPATHPCLADRDQPFQRLDCTLARCGVSGVLPLVVTTRRRMRSAVQCASQA